MTAARWLGRPRGEKSRTRSAGEDPASRALPSSAGGLDFLRDLGGSGLARFTTEDEAVENGVRAHADRTVHARSGFAGGVEAGDRLRGFDVDHFALERRDEGGCAGTFPWRATGLRAWA